ncbi:MAG: phage major capsid protein, partial [Anaerolineae bacterium]|nr:phage major capsid protein [Anaerolineae bacterium]
GYVMLRAAKGFRGVSEQYANALAHKVRRGGLSALKADELSTSTQAGYGDEWVPDLWSAELWRQARLENVILPLLRAVEMPSNPYELPVEGADPTVYYVPETADESSLTLGSANPIPDSKIGSGKVTLAAKKLALRVGFSAELAEDSLIPILSMYREQAMRALSGAIDSVILNGDTETGATGNINSDDAAPASGATCLAFDGLRKLPLVTTTANAVSAGGEPSLALLRQARFTMAHRYSINPRHLAWIVDGGTYARLLGLDEFLMMDKAGPQATALTGQIGYVDGIPVLVSAEMPLTMADGKVNATGNTKGQAVCVYRPGWIVGYRRRIAASMDYLPYYDAYQMTATVRLALAPLDGDVAAALYNVTV